MLYAVAVVIHGDVGPVNTLVAPHALHADAHVTVPEVEAVGALGRSLVIMVAALKE